MRYGHQHDAGHRGRPACRRRHRLRVRLLFGLFEADASGALGISAVVLMFVLMGAGRWFAVW